MDAQEILAGLEEAVVAVDIHGEVLYSNPASETLLGGDLRRDPSQWRSLRKNNAWIDEGLRAALNEVRSYVRHQMRLQVGLEARPVALRVTPVFDASGKQTGAICLFVDESSLITLSESVRRLDKLRELGTVAAGLAHEIKNPLGGILGSAQLLRAEGLPPEAMECVEVIERDVRRINRLLEDLLDFGNEKESPHEWLNLHRLLDDVIQGLEKDTLANGHAFVRDYDPSLPEIRGAPDKLHQVFLNLIKNALEASPAGEPIVVRTRVDLAGRRAPKRAALVDIQNRGKAIAPDVRERLFTPFFTTKNTGAGLGLIVSLRIVREHRGSLDVQSDPERTVFTVALPMERTVEK